MSILTFRPIYPKSTWKRIALGLSAVTIIVPVILVVRAAIVLGSIPQFKTHWEERQKEVPANNAIRLVGLGDSAMHGIGANKPELGLFGRVETYLKQKTGRPVYAANISVTGAKVNDVVKNQLSQLERLKADIIIVSISGNDANNQINLKQFETDINKLYAALPKDKTVVSDVPGVDHREPYQTVLLAAAAKYQLRVAPIYENFRPHNNDYSAYAGDFFHPSSQGYNYWFNAFRPYIDETIKNLKM